MKLRKWGVALLSLLLVVALTGCLGKIYTKALTVDGEEISAGLYLMMQMQAYSDAKGLAEDSEKDVLKQKIEGQSAKEWIREHTLEYCVNYVAVRRLCAERGIELNEANAQTLKTEMASWGTYEVFYAQNGIGKDTVRDFLEAQFLSTQLFEEMYKEGGELAPTREEIEEEYGDKNGHVRFVVLNMLDELGEELEGREEALEYLEEMIEKLNDEEAEFSFNDAVRQDIPIVEAILTPLTDEDGEELDPYETEPLEIEYDDDGEEIDPSTIGTYYISYTPDENGVYSEEFLTRLKEEAVGTCGFYDVDGMVLVYEKIETFQDDDQFDNNRDNIVAEMKQDEYTEFVKDYAADYTITWVPGAVWYLNPDKIKV